MLDSRPQGAAYRMINGQPYSSKLDLQGQLFDGEPLWDKKVLELTMSLHFDKLINRKQLSEQYGMAFAPHMILPWLERYLEEAQRLNDLNRVEPVKMDICVERAQKMRLTPIQAEKRISSPIITKKRMEQPR